MPNFLEETRRLLDLYREARQVPHSNPFYLPPVTNPLPYEDLMPTNQSNSTQLPNEGALTFTAPTTDTYAVSDRYSFTVPTTDTYAMSAGYSINSLPTHKLDGTLTKTGKRDVVIAFAKELKELLGDNYEYTHKKKESDILTKLFAAMDDLK